MRRNNRSKNLSLLELITKVGSWAAMTTLVIGVYFMSVVLLIGYIPDLFVLGAVLIAVVIAGMTF